MAQGLWEEAFAALDALATSDPPDPYSLRAAWDLVVLTDRMAAAERPCPPAAGQRVDLLSLAACAGAPRPRTSWEQRELDAIDRYLQLSGGGPNTPWCLYRHGWVLYVSGNYAAANATFDAVVRIDPSSRDAAAAAHRILDSYLIVGDWVNLRNAAWTFLNMPGLGSPEFKQEVQRIQDEAMAHINE